jgi:hypothetical protein
MLLLYSQGPDLRQIVPTDVKSTDTYDPAIPYKDKKISEMVIEFAQGPGENTSTRSVELDQPLNLLDLIELSLPYHLISTVNRDW